MGLFRHTYHACFIPELIKVLLEVTSGLEKLRLRNVQQKKIRVKLLK